MKQRQKKYQKEYNELLPSIFHSLRYIRDHTDYHVYKDHVDCLVSPLQRAVDVLRSRKKLTPKEDDICVIWSNVIDKMKVTKPPTKKRRNHFKDLIDIILQQKEETYKL